MDIEVRGRLNGYVINKIVEIDNNIKNLINRIKKYIVIYRLFQERRLMKIYTMIWQKLRRIYMKKLEN